MGVVLIIIIAIVIFVVYSNNKEKERQESWRRTEAANIREKYNEGCDEYLRQKWGKNYSYNRYPSRYLDLSDDEALSHKSEIIKLHNEVIARYRAAARIDEQFETEQKTFNEKCIALSKEHLPNEGRYHYDVKWIKNKSNGGWSKEKFTVWQFFVSDLCLNQELDYSCSTYYKEQYSNLPNFKDKNRYWNQLVYDRINTFISAIAQSSSRPLIIAFVDTKDGWSNDALIYHTQKIKKDIPNTIISPLSQLKTNIAGIGNQLEHLIVVDVYTENAQLISICENIEKQFNPSHTAITYISLLKCYDTEEMEKIIKDDKAEYGEKKKKEKLESEYNRIKKKYPIGTEYYEKYEKRYGKTQQEMVVGDEEGVAKYEVIYGKYLDLKRKYPLGLPAFEDYHSYDDGENSARYTIEEIIEYEDEIRRFEQKEINKLKQQQESLPTKVKNWDTLQNGMHYHYLLRYYPTTCEFEATDDEWDDRYIVWNFKNDPTKVSEDDHNEAMTWVVQNVKDRLLDTFGKDSLKLLTLVCIPASNKLNMERRYKEFSSTLCNETGMENAYSHITITKDASPKHLGGSGKPTIEFDAEFFKKKNVIIFDDVITSGRSMLLMKQKLVGLGATVIAGLSIGKTFHHRPDSQVSSPVLNSRRNNDFNDDLPF
jgi:hypothetical protein